MDLVSALSGINTGNPIAGIASTALQRGSQSVPASSSASTEPSARVFFSSFVSDALAQQSSNPGLSIDTLIARNLAGLAPGLTGGQLYTASGLLQQFATSLLVDQLDGEPTTAQSVAPFTDLGDASGQIALQANESLLTTVPQTDVAASTNTGALPGRNTVQAQSVPATIPASTTSTIEPDAITTTEVTVAAEGLNSTQLTAADPQSSDARVNASTSATVLDTTAQATGELDPYVQAALISGLTSAGKEQHSFVQAASYLLTERAIAAVAAVSRIAAIEGETADTSVFA